MSELDLTAAIEAATKAIEAYQYIPDAGDGYPAIRMGTPESVARVAVEAAAQVIQQAIGEQLEQLDLDALVNGVVLNAAFGARERRVREQVAMQLDALAVDGEVWAGNEEAAYANAAAIARGSVSGAKAADQ